MKNDRTAFFNTLAKAFGGLVAVDGASFDIPEGSITGLIGPNVIAAILEHIDTRGARAPPIASV